MRYANDCLGNIVWEQLSWQRMSTRAATRLEAAMTSDVGAL